jgi:hypothetical protein
MRKHGFLFKMLMFLTFTSIYTVSSNALAQCLPSTGNSSSWANLWENNVATTSFWQCSSCNNHHLFYGVQAGNNYSFTASGPTAGNFLTITSQVDNTVLFSGSAPFTWNSGTFSGNIRVRRTNNSACTNTSGTQTVNVNCTDCATPQNLIPCLSNWSNGTMSLWSTMPIEFYVTNNNYYTVQGIQAGQDYAVNIVSGTATYVTISDEANNALFLGYAPFTWNSDTYSGTIRVHIANSPQCASNINANATISVQCESCEELTPEPCIFTNGWNQYNIQGGGFQTYIDAWGEEYSIISGVQASTDYQFDNGSFSMFLTLTDEDNNVLYYGFTPFLWNSDNVSGNIRVHASQNPGCAAAQNYFFISCANCPCTWGNPSWQEYGLWSNEPITINGDWNGEWYNINNIQANSNYYFSENQYYGYGSWLVLTDENNSVLFSGYGPFTWNSDGYSGTLRLHVFEDEFCNSAYFQMTIQCLDCPVEEPTPCVYFNGTWNSYTLSGNQQIYYDVCGNPNICGWSGQYSTDFYGILANQDYYFSEDFSGYNNSAFITITDASYNVLYYGFAPFTWNSGEYSGNIYVHTSQNPGCSSIDYYYGYIQCLNCPCVFSNNSGWTTYTYTGTSEQIFMDSWGDEYFPVYGVEANQDYYFSENTSYGFGYVNITDENNNLIFGGSTPFTWNSGDFTGTIHVHMSYDENNCFGPGGQMYTQCLSCPCIYSNGWQYYALTNNDPVTINYGWSSEYFMIDGIQAWNNYQFTENIYGYSSYLILTDNSNNILYSGYAPFEWNAGAYSGIIHVHPFQDDNCTQIYDFQMDVYCLTCLCDPAVVEPIVACWETAILNNSTCTWEISGTQPDAPTNLACWEMASFDEVTCSWIVSGTQPEAPSNLACWETASFDEVTCSWVVSGTQPEAPSNLACWETASFDEVTCSWVVSGTAPVATISSSTGTTLNCSNPFTALEATGGSTVWTQEGAFFGTANPILVTYFTSGSITYGVTVTDANGCTASTDIVITMEDPSPAPTNLACYETATFDYNSCGWVVSGTQPEAPTGIACYETAAFDDVTCAWVVSGTQPEQPSLACYETASFDIALCAWVVSGTPTIPAFAAVGPYCSGTSIPALPIVSIDNISGTWSPAINNSVTTEYTFTPDAGECASTTTLTIVIQNCGGDAPENDEPCNAIDVTSAGQTSLNTFAFLSSMACNNEMGTNVNGTPDAVAPSCVGISTSGVWYTFTTPMCDVNGQTPFLIEVTTDSPNTDFNTFIAVYESSNNACTGSLIEVACNLDNTSSALCLSSSNPNVSSLALSNLEPNKQYWIYVDGAAGATGTFEISGRVLAFHAATPSGNGTSVTLTAENTGAGLYTYYYQQVGSSGYSVANSSSLSDTRVLASNVSYNTQVMYRCDATDNFNQSQWYRTQSETLFLESQCAVVNDMTCTFNGPNSYTLTWTEPAGELFTNNGAWSGYRIKRNPVGTTSVFTFGNPAVVCVDGTCSVTLAGNNPNGFNWTIETRCSATTVQIGNTSTCGPQAPEVPNNPSAMVAVKASERTHSFKNIEAGIEFVDVQMFDAYADFGLNTPMTGDYEIYVNANNEVNWRRVDTSIDANFDFVIVPNPSNAMTTVFLNTIVEEGSFTIVDAMGRTIQTGSINNTDNVNFDAAQLQSGVYMVVVTVGNQKMTRRLVVAD